MDGKEWYFNTATGQAEQGLVSPVNWRMGPYKTRAEALDAWKIVKKRNKKWDQDDKEWKAAWDGENGDGLQGEGGGRPASDRGGGRGDGDIDQDHGQDPGQDHEDGLGWL
ncbi:hypothetical protein [Bifidobacterium favimelis]|uniref:SPOR domain-containing protein n=1 Tax=Bifidobacterium favimelis TaxID=3122979 RepID=A0ABU8ZNA9_9BIFI